MINQDLISVIVPVYKVEKYLKRCVESIQNQTHQNLEIILVDDGSPDKCGIMCDELALQDNRIVVYHKENGGLSDARNYGVTKANGTYIGFVDSDDYIHPEMYSKLLEIIKKENADVAECGVTRVYENMNRIHCVTDNLYEVMDEKKYFRELLEIKKIYGGVWCKLIKKDVATQILFEKGKYYEDLFYNLELIQIAKKYIFISNSYYFYYIRENSITTEKFSHKHLTLLEAMHKYYDYCKNNYPELENQAFIRLSLAYLSIFNHIIVEKNYKLYSEFFEMKSYLKQNAFKILSSKNASKQLKISLFFIKLNIPVYRLLYKLHKERMVLNK